MWKDDDLARLGDEPVIAGKEWVTQGEMQMKKFIIEQTGYVQVEATRRFVVEAPDDVDDGQVYDLVKAAEPAADDEDMAWRDELDRKWIGFDVDVAEIDVCEAESDEPSLEGMKAIKLDELQEEANAQ